MRCSAHTTGQSAPGRRIGSFGLASSPLVPFPLASKRLVLAIPRKSLCWCHVPYTLVAACPVIRLPAGWSQEIETLLVLTTVLWITTRLRRVHFRSSHQSIPAQGDPWTFAPALTTAALNRRRLEWFGTRP